MIFADAYVRAGEQEYKAGHIPQGTPLPRDARDDNGWGFVVRIHDMVYCCHGRATKKVLDRVTFRRAFILYALEVFAQLMAVFMLADRLPDEWVAFIDNTAGEEALKKGYGKDALVNAMYCSSSGPQRLDGAGDRSSPGSSPKQTSLTSSPEPPHAGDARGMATHRRARRTDRGHPRSGGLQRRVCGQPRRRGPLPPS